VQRFALEDALGTNSASSTSLAAVAETRWKPTALQPKEFDQADPDSREYGAQIRRQEIRLARWDVAAVT
jgi:hypothetical protein